LSELYCYEEYKGCELFVSNIIVDRKLKYEGTAIIAGKEIFICGDDGEDVLNRLIILVDEEDE